MYLMTSSFVSFSSLPNRLIDAFTLLLQFSGNQTYFYFRCLNTNSTSHILSITIENDISYFTPETSNAAFQNSSPSIPNEIDIAWLMNNFDVIMSLDIDYFPQFIILMIDEEVMRYSLSSIPPVLDKPQPEIKIEPEENTETKVSVEEDQFFQREIDQHLKLQEESKKKSLSKEILEPTIFKEIEFFPDDKSNLNKDKKNEPPAPKEIWDQVRLLGSIEPGDFQGLNPLPPHEEIHDEFNSKLEPSGVYQTDICKKISSLCDLNSQQYIVGKTDGGLHLMSKESFTEVPNCKFINNPHYTKGDIWSLIKIQDDEGIWLLASSWDKSVSVWDLIRFVCIGQFKENENWVYSTLHIREKIVASGGWDSRFIFWNFKTFQQIYTINYYGYVHQLVKYNRNVIVSVGWEGNIRFWDVSSVKQTKEIVELRIKDEYPITTVVIVNSETAAVGTQVGQISIYNLQSKKMLKHLSCNEWIQRLTFLSRTIFGVSSTDQTARIINVKNLVEEVNLQNHSGYVNDMIRLNNHQILVGGLSSTRRWGELPK